MALHVGHDASFDNMYGRKQEKLIVRKLIHITSNETSVQLSASVTLAIPHLSGVHSEVTFFPRGIPHSSLG
jgi:hypothetical protein